MGHINLKKKNEMNSKQNIRLLTKLWSATHDAIKFYHHPRLRRTMQICNNNEKRTLQMKLSSGWLHQDDNHKGMEFFIFFFFGRRLHHACKTAEIRFCQWCNFDDCNTISCKLHIAHTHKGKLISIGMQMMALILRWEQKRKNTKHALTK